MKEYVPLTTAAMKMCKIHFYSDHSNGCLEEKNASLGNSMLNHPEHVTLTSWIFMKFLPSSSEFIAFLKKEKMMLIGGTTKYYIFLESFYLK